MKKYKLLLQLIPMEIILILCIAFANFNPTPAYYFLFYNLIYGLIFSLILPLYYMRKEKRTLASAGLKRMGLRQVIVLICCVVFSVGGQLIPKILAGALIPWHLLPLGILPLIMTTFFEEFLFRGFVQSRVEQQFGWLPAIFVSGLMFSLYHLGYPGFRTLEDIFLLFAVGLGFAIAYKLSDNHLIVSYFVNLPNAFITYILKYNQFPTMRFSSTIAAIITLILIVTIVFRAWKNDKRVMISILP